MQMRGFTSAGTADKANEISPFDPLTTSDIVFVEVGIKAHIPKTMIDTNVFAVTRRAVVYSFDNTIA